MGREEEENTQADQMPALWALQNMGEDMTDEEFNRYCAEVRCIHISPNYKGGLNYHPATDLNQMAEAFDKLLANERIPKAFTVFSGQEIAQAMREFIESTKGESE